jgi:FkbM family methyltransferase
MSLRLKSYVQTVLKRIGLYHRLKASRLYYLYWAVLNKSIVDDERREVDFYRDLLDGFRQGDLIFDIGANHGSKTSIFLRLGARVLAVDPDEFNKEILEKMFLRWRLTPRAVVVVNKAVSDGDAIETMWIDEPGSAKNTFSQKWVETLRVDNQRFGHTLGFAQRKEVQTTTLETLIITYGLPFFIKIDVEGHEPNVLRGLDRPVPYLSFEVNLPEFRTEGLQCVERLARLAADGQFNYAIDCRQGLLRKEWLGPEETSRLLNQCTDDSIEVFWRAPVSTKR